MNVYDTVTADQLDGGEQILIIRQVKRDIQRIPLENVSVVLTENDHVMVSGYSHDTGDRQVFMLWADEEVELWSV